MSRIFLIRHGQSQGNVDNSKYDQYFDSDIELTEKGEADARKSALKIGELWDILHSQRWNRDLIEKTPNSLKCSMFFSPYTRASQTAKIIAETISKEVEHVEICDMTCSHLLHERRWGSLRQDVLKYKKGDTRRNQLFQFFNRPENGESFSDAYQRVVLFDMWMNSVTKHQTNIVVAHGELNKLYMMHLLGWAIEEFEKYKNPKNGEVFLIEDGMLSPMTPLTLIKTALS